jgi:hypothetical protein
MGVHWVVEEGFLRVEPGDGVIAWTFRNDGDEPAAPLSQRMKAAIWSDRISPWEQELDFPTGTDDVAPEHSTPMHVTPTWDGQEPGTYWIRVDFNDGTAMAETVFAIDQWGRVARPHDI